jgi:hypothetical protein
MSPSPLPSPLPIKPAPTAREPELVSKWTIVNDEWVSVYRQIVRTSSGLREIPQQAIARSEK